jgi:hypothetical protein
LNFVGVPPGAVRSSAVDPDPHGREVELDRRLEEVTGRREDTVVAAALAITRA